jgi:hypothetical protein
MSANNADNACPADAASLLDSAGALPPRRTRSREHGTRTARGPRSGTPTRIRPATSKTIGSRSPGRGSSPTVAASRTRVAWTSTAAWSTSYSLPASSRSPRSTTGTCRRLCRTSTAAGSRRRPPRPSPTTPGTWPHSSATGSSTSSRSTSSPPSSRAATRGLTSRSAAARPSTSGPRRAFGSTPPV